MQLTTPIIWGLSGRDLILIIGGLFLIGKSTFEIHEKLEAADHTQDRVPATVTFTSVIVQIVLVDIIFSLDSVITAVGISGVLWVMVSAIIVAAAAMLFFAGTISAYVERHPSMKILALAFLILIGTMLVIEGLLPEVAHEYHIKNYAYVAMAFAFIVELINIRVRGGTPVHLHNQPTLAEAGAAAGPTGTVTTKYEAARPQRTNTRATRKSRRK
jgi:predicted tellurium resistance membrane protein TerC